MVPHRRKAPPGRTDNEVKNYWNSHLCKKLRKEGFVFNQTTSKRPKRSQAHNGRCRKMGSEETQPQTPYMQIYSPKPTRIVPWLGSCNLNDRGGEEEEEGSSGRNESCASMVYWPDEKEVENLLCPNRYLELDLDLACFDFDSLEREFDGEKQRNCLAYP
ncbi:hypothetical protein HPP92_014628 [Vanilla planifolia]|uniref:HTH myb-type domain-containing protein n=1 Tax=Vanilla planifolia TaxID=51239 RepID=A0A835QW73_VANPL|nr:hypothetical protein HPP92_014628 [Vanilla planifolia]